MLEKSAPIVYSFHTSQIFFLTDIYFKGIKTLYTDVAICYNPLSGEFNIINGPEDDYSKVLSIGHLSDKIIALEKTNRFLLLSNSKWVVSSIPPLPVNDFDNPLIFKYQSFLLVIDGSVMWVHDNGIGDWMKFQLLTSEGPLQTSPKNSLIILAGKLFMCLSSEKSVYSVDLQQVVHTVLSAQVAAQQESESKEEGRKRDTFTKAPNSQHTLQLNLILKGANFIFLHSNHVLAFHTTKLTRVSSTYIDRVWYYDVQCYHWHNAECVCPDIINGTWFSMAGCAGIAEFSTAWKGWGRAKLYKIKLTHQQ